MASENWEEINAWDVEEDMDMDLMQRITVHTVRHLNTGNANENDAEDFEYQLIQAHKYPTYAAATKWGIHHKNRKSININTDGDKLEKQEEKVKKEKENVQRGVLLGAPAKPTSDSHMLNSCYDEFGFLINIQPPSDPDPVNNSSRSVSRRHNNHVHKLSNQRLLNQLVGPFEFELNAGLARGDTNRDLEFKKYKIMKKSLPGTKRNSKDRKSGNGGVDKLRVEAW